MYAAGRVVAMVDWELAHLGDPMDDIAWLSLRATQEPFTDFPARLREYEQLSGHRHRRRPCAVLPRDGRSQVAGHEPSPLARGRPTRCRRRRHMPSSTDCCTGVSGSRPWPWRPPSTSRRLRPLHPATPRDHEWMYAALLEQLRRGHRAADQRSLASTREPRDWRGPSSTWRRSMPTAWFFETLRARGPRGRCWATLPSGLAEGRDELATAVRRQRVPATRSTSGTYGGAWRAQTELARPAMGALADRHWPALT